MPLTQVRTVEASFLGSILNNSPVYAVTNAPSSNNSQTMQLLQVNASSMQLFQKKTEKETAGSIAPDATVNILSDNSLLASASPQTSVVDAVGGGDFSLEEEDLEIYVVKAGDTAQVIADMFEVSVDTIYSANEIPKGSKLSVGDVLLILPFSGVEHTVAKGETPQTIASKYKVELKDILSANDLGIEDKLSVGEKLMIPGGNIASETKPKTPAGKTVATKGKVVSSLPSVSGYFKNPVPGARRTRGIQSGHRGVDLAAPTGTPIYAAAAGTAIIARNGYNGGFGNYVVIQHGNGTKTLYAHMSKLGTTPGAKVAQGEVIGYVGNSGRSRGAHLHIEVLGGKNPF